MFTVVLEPEADHVRFLPDLEADPTGNTFYLEWARDVSLWKLAWRLWKVYPGTAQRDGTYPSWIFRDDPVCAQWLPEWVRNDPQALEALGRFIDGYLAGVRVAATRWEVDCMPWQPPRKRGRDEEEDGDEEGEGGDGEGGPGRRGGLRDGSTPRRAIYVRD
jgi:hypothetical protein